MKHAMPSLAVCVLDIVPFDCTLLSDLGLTAAVTAESRHLGFLQQDEPES